MPRFVYLTDITQTPLRMESMLYDRWNNQKIKLSRIQRGLQLLPDGPRRQGEPGRRRRGSCASTTAKLYYQVDLDVPDAAGRRAGVARPDKSELEKLVADKVVEAADAKRVLRVRARTTGTRC